jgi:putative membrane protein
LYERTIAAISRFKGKNVIPLLQYGFRIIFSNRRKDNLKLFADQAQSLDIPFLIRLLTGVGSAILLLSALMKYLLENHYSNTFAFIFGLITISAILSTRMLKVKKPLYIIHFLTGIAIAVIVISSVDPSVNTKIKSDNYKARLEASELVMTNPDARPDVRLKYLNHYTARELTIAGGSGAVAICATIMPGPSGSLVLILLGQYHEALTAISGLRSLQLDYFVFLAIMAMGMGIGMLLFSRVINYVLKRFYNGAVAFMIGVTAGSLYALWPFKQTIIMDKYVKQAGEISLIKNAAVQTNINIFPNDIAIILPALLFFFIGVAIMATLYWYGMRGRDQSHSAKDISK